MRIAKLVLVASSLAAVPAVAQERWGYPDDYRQARTWDGNNYRYRQGAEQRIQQEFRQLSWQYQRAVQANRIDRREASRLEPRLGQIDRLGSLYSRDGLNRGERERLERMLRDTRRELEIAARDGNRRNGYRDADYGRW